MSGGGTHMLGALTVRRCDPTPPTPPGLCSSCLINLIPHFEAPLWPARRDPNRFTLQRAADTLSVLKEDLQACVDGALTKTPRSRRRPESRRSAGGLGLFSASSAGGRGRSGAVSAASPRLSAVPGVWNS